ncbi:MAG: adenylyl-sulfate kinase [Bacteroidota bacterium]
MIATSAQGAVLWITGLSGAGKSTVGHAVAERLRNAGRPTAYLDGDVLREILGAVDAHSPAERLELAHIYGRMCRALSAQGLTVVCSTISMFHEVRRQNRATIPGYVEIYLRVPIEELSRRDAKGLYARGKNLVGCTLPFEEPEAPDLLIDNHGPVDPAWAVACIMAHLGLETSP